MASDSLNLQNNYVRMFCANNQDAAMDQQIDGHHEWVDAVDALRGRVELEPLSFQEVQQDRDDVEIGVPLLMVERLALQLLDVVVEFAPPFAAVDRAGGNLTEVVVRES